MKISQIVLMLLTIASGVGIFIFLTPLQPTFAAKFFPANPSLGIMLFILLIVIFMSSLSILILTVNSPQQKIHRH